MKSVKDRIPAPSQDASRWLRGLLLLIWLLMPGQPSTAEDFWILGRTESNHNYLLEFPSLTSEYHLVSTCSRLTNADWGLTGLVLGAEGVTAWRDEGALARTPQRYYRISSRPVSQPVDSDGDGIDDVYEMRHAALLDPLRPGDAALDADSDGLSNQQEYAHGSDLEKPDTDGDGLTDYDEVMVHGTSPRQADSDGDQLPDGWELAYELNPREDDGGLDPDGDLLDNRGEHAAASHPRQADTDSDGLPDGWEVGNGLSPVSDGGLAQGLVARWTFDEGAGGVASNRVSTNWAGTLRFMVESNWLAGRGGRALWFNGINGHVAISQASGAVVTGAPFTVTAVIWQETDATEFATVVSDVSLLSGNRWPGYVLRYQRSLNTLTALAGNTNSLTGMASVGGWSPDQAGRWVDIALSHDGTQARLFVEGREVAAVTQGFDAWQQAELRIGGGHVNIENAYWRGLIDEVRIYRNALGTNQLAAVNDWLGDPDEDGLNNGREWKLGSDPRDADTDGDGLGDLAEVDVHGTSPVLADTDGDGLPDAWEVANGLNPLVANADGDADGDGLVDLQEMLHGTDPQDADTDDDGLSDQAEVLTHGTHPLLADTDSDGLPDAWEVTQGVNPLVDDANDDPDNDELTNRQELARGTDPQDADTDDDGLPDGWEVAHGLNPLVNDAAGDPDGDGLTNLQEHGSGTDPQDADSDDDGLTDEVEVVTHGTNPRTADTDGDGLADAWEVANGLNPLVADASEDPDGDGLTNLQEQAHGTDPWRADTDGDGLTDGAEAVTHGTNPRMADSDSDGLPDGWEVANGLNPLSDGGLVRGLVARWTFDEGAGAVASNRVSPNWPGMLRNMGSGNWTAGRNGGALLFDGSNDYVAVAQGAGAVVTGAPFTLTAVIWQAAEEGPAFPTVVSDATLLGDGRWPGLTLRQQQAANILAGLAGNTNAPAGMAAVGNWRPGHAGRWVDVGLAHDGARAQLFVGGKQVASAVHGFDAWQQAELWIGAGHVNTADAYWRGRIDDVRIYRSALGTNELAEVNDWLGDPDGDGLINGREWEQGSDPRRADTDGDGLGDLAEVDVHGTSPVLADTDGDGMPDAWEVAHGLNPLVNDAAGDPDGDGLTNLQEMLHGTDPWRADSDDDGLNDYEEVVTHGTDPWNPDSDGDGLNDYEEAVTHGTDPWNPDSDGDGLPDRWEVLNGLDPLDGAGSQGYAGDPDGDTLTNGQEFGLGTHPLQADTDGDGLADNEEQAHGTDPLNPDSDYDGLPDGWEVQHQFTPLSGMGADLDLRCWLRFDEGSGTVLSNSAATAVQASIPAASGFVWTNGIHGGALWLDGTNGYAAIAQPAGPVVLGPDFTICAWVWQETDSAAAYPTLFSDSRWTGGSDWPGYFLRVNRDQNQLLGFVGQDGRPSVEVAAAWWRERWSGKWTHVALVQSGSTSRLYLDGSLWSSQNNRFGPASNAAILIGRGHVNHAISGWRGRMDDLRIYGKALPPARLRELFDARADANGDGTNNLASWQNGLDPRAAAAPVAAEGALDLQFIPQNWTAHEAPQYLARFGDSNPGDEIHLYVENDTLNFLLIDADGQRHSIQHARLVGGGYLLSNATNRITASWRGFNTGRKTAEMRLYVNGLDYKADLGFVNNPRRTSYDWETGGSYNMAAYMSAAWSSAVTAGGTCFGAWAEGVLTAKVQLVEARIHATAYGMVATNPVPPFGVTNKVAPPAGPRPRTMLQGISRPRIESEFVSSNEMRTLVKRYAQVTDAVENEVSWMWWGDQSSNTWHIMEDNIRTCIEIGNQEGLDIALSTATHLDAKICRKYANAIPQQAQHLVVVTNGNEARLVLTNSAWYVGETLLAWKFDVGDRVTVSNYLAAWKQDLAQFSGYSYFFFNEEKMQSPWDPSYLDGPTYSSNSLAWFREYSAAKYGSAYSQIRFPISPLAVDVVGGTNETAYTVVLDASVTNRAVITSDPDHWAKWWEWRQVMFAHLLDGYTRNLAELNAGNPHWKGAIHFISPSTAWSLKPGLNLELLARIPHLDWMVMENTRGFTYGTSLARTEEEILLQLEAARAVTSTNTGFGSYAMAHTYPYPQITNGTTNATFNISWLTQDVAYAAAPEFQSSLVVPYSAAMLVNRPGYTSVFQNTTYIPEVADAWLKARFGTLWSRLQGHGITGLTGTNTTVRFTWAALEQAQAYDWQLSVQPGFGTTNRSAQTAATNWNWSMLTHPAPAGQPLYWRVRGVFHVKSFNDAGVVTGTNFYYGAWAQAPAAVNLVDTDGDQLPDAWEQHYFGNLAQTAAGNPDGDAANNLAEYLAATPPNG